MPRRAKNGKSVRARPSTTSTAEEARSQEHSSSQTHTHTTSEVESSPSTNGGTQSVSQEGSNTDATSNKRGRGRAKSWKGWGKKKMILSWNELCQPLAGEHKSNFATQLGYFARQGNLFPLTLPSWREADEHHLKTVWKNIQENTNAPDGFEKICYAKIGESWRKFKNQIKETYYKKYQTDEERLARVPIGIEQDQWQELVARWGTSDSKRIAAQNTENRANLNCYHKMGKKSFAEVREEMKANNLQVDKLSVFMYTRKMNKEGPSEDDGSAEKEEMIRRKLDELSLEDRNNEEMRDKIFNEVVGEDGHGRALCMGVGIAPSSKRLKTSSSSSQNNDSDIERLRQEAEEREIRHQEEIDMMRAETDEKIKKSNEYFINIIRRAGIDIPDDAPW